MTNPRLQVVEGDITRIQADAIITAINSQGLWFGKIDGAIQRAAGNFYHSQAQRAMPLKDLQIIVARGGARPDRKIPFRDVVFVVDDLQSPLNKVIYTGLEASSNEGYKEVLIPTIRMGVMNGVVERTEKEAIEKMSLGISEFLDRYAEQTKLENISFVVYNNSPLAKRLNRTLG